MSFAQEEREVLVTYTKKDASLEDIFNDLEEQYGIRFSYATTSIENKVLDADFENKSIEDVLDYLFSDGSMEYKIISNNVLLKKSNSFQEMEGEGYNSSLHVRGKITNSNDIKEALDFATITVSNSVIGSYSDAQGNFDIEIPKEYMNESIVIHYLGYEDAIYRISELDDQYLLVAMKGGQISIDEIMIVNKEKPLRIRNANNSIILNNSQIESETSGVMGADIGRQIQLLPGIAAHEDNSAAIKIRGSNSDETLMVLDGMPIYNANHYYGVFSGVSTSYIDSVNIFKNSYPLHYGGRTAGLVELFSDNSHPTKTETNLNLDLLTASADARIPISHKSHLSIAGRSTIKKINNNLFHTSKTPSKNDSALESLSQKVDNRKNDPSFTFYDVNAKYQYQNDRNDVFTLNFFRSCDDVTNTFKTLLRDKNENELKLDVKDDQYWSNTAASMILSKNLDSGLKWKTTAYFTHYMNEEVNGFYLSKKYNPGGLPSPPDKPDMTFLNSKQKNELMDLSIDSHLDYNLGASSVQLGLMTTHHDIAFSFEENQKDKLVGNDRFYEWAAYAGYDFQLGSKWKVNTGIRSTYFTHLKTTKQSPRILLSYQASERISFKSSYNVENQVIRQLLYEYRGEPKELWVTANGKEIPVLRSHNVMLGTTFSWSPFTIDVEFYRKNMKGQLEYFLPNAGDASNNPDQIREYKLFKGNGLVRGVDIIVSSGYKSYDTYISYTWSRSEQQFKEVFRNVFFASENDRTHQLKWINTWNTGNFTWGLNGIYVSGRPYTDIRNLGQNIDLRDFNPKDRLKRVKAYHRIDISASYALNIRRYDVSLSASIYNLLNTKNVQYIQSISTQDKTGQKIIVGNESELLNRTINFGLHIGF